ncbi:MAG: DUF4189 domain-containing protein [Hyphomicrobiaceae bacterium]|nr:DUF4189 domain-containing protein [Hyphomicrobiaceae bacterium]
MRDRALALLCMATLAATTLAGYRAPALADGAIAVGTTGNVVRDGIAFGMVVDVPKEQASEAAIQRCRSFEARDAADQCKVVATFSGECFAIAYDPQPGTPGAGWGVGPDQLAANQKAIAMCEEAAGPARKGYCQIERGGCDTKGRRGAVEPGSQAPVIGNAKPGLEASTARPATSPVGPAAEARRVPAPPAPKEKKRPAPKEKKEHYSWFGSPALVVGAMVTVGAAYTLGQIARGRLQSGFGERQLIVGGCLAVATGAVVKLLALVGLQQTLALAVAGLIAVVAALLA